VAGVICGLFGLAVCSLLRAGLDWAVHEDLGAEEQSREGLTGFIVRYSEPFTYLSLHILMSRGE
jgi:hypothetical protein